MQGIQTLFLETKTMEPRTRDLTRTMMRRQLKLSFKVGSVFILLLIVLPVLNQFAPQIMEKSVGGFSVSWLILAVLFYPLTLLLSAWFVRGTERIEAEIVAENKK
jgi:uncharacterized membrane protein (DUF485 family)